MLAAALFIGCLRCSQQLACSEEDAEPQPTADSRWVSRIRDTAKPNPATLTAGEMVVAVPVCQLRIRNRGGSGDKRLHLVGRLASYGMNAVAATAEPCRLVVRESR